MRMFDIFDPVIDVTRPCFLEASAGTGKTFAIENLIPRLLLEAKEPLRIENIAVVTFTRAATRELKRRIYENLIRIAAALERGSGGPKYLDTIFLQGRQAVSSARLVMEEAIVGFEGAGIFTLHGFALHLLRTFSLEADFLPPDPEEEERKEQELRRCLHDFLKTGINRDLFSPSEIRKLCSQRKIGKDGKALIKALLSVLHSGHSIRRYDTAIERFSACNAFLGSLPPVSEEELRSDYAVLAPRIARSGKWEEQEDILFSAITERGISRENWDRLLEEKELFLTKIRPLSENKGKGSLHSDIFERLGPLIQLHKEATDPSILLLRMASAASGQYSLGKKRMAHASVDDYIQRVNLALDSPAFFDAVRNRYRALVIDEFQDTDPDQWKMFRSLFFSSENPCSSVFLVGDPKQSIYGFRSADVYTYLEAKEYFPEDRRFYLGVNYRSAPDLVRALNALFSRHLPPDWMILPRNRSSLPVRPVEPGREDVEKWSDPGKGRVHFFPVEGESESIIKQKIFSYIADEIARLSEKGVPYRKMAVLVKDRYEADGLQAVLRDRGIPLSVQKRLSVQDEAFRVMEDIILGLDNPFDLTVMKRFLASPLVGYGEKSIAGGEDNPLLLETIELFSAGARITRDHGFGTFFSNLLQTVFQGKTIQERLLAAEDDTLFFSLRRILQIFLEYCPEGIRSPKELLVFREKLSEDDSSDILNRFSEEEENRVVVMTVHKSKGLEFEFVFALAGGSRHTGKESYIPVRKDKGKELAVADDIEIGAYREEIEAEKLRQLYVMLTRARERVYIPLPNLPFSGNPSPMELLTGAFGLHEYRLQDVYGNLQSVSFTTVLAKIEETGRDADIRVESLGQRECHPLPRERPILIPPSPLSLSFPPSYIRSFSSWANTGKKGKDPYAPFEEIPSDPFDLPVGSETGTVIHAILEALCKADLHHDLSEKGKRMISDLCSGSCLEGREESVIDLVFSCLRTPIRTDRETFCLAEIPGSDIRSETEFLYPTEFGFLKGFIDVIFRYRGRYFLLDWKTNRLGSSPEEYTESRIIGCMEEHRYDLQAAIYASAMKRYFAPVDKRPFRGIFGGAIYFFLRGRYPYFFSPDLSLAILCEQERFVWTEE